MSSSFRTIFIAGVLVLAFVGCGERGPKTVPVYGTVTFAGRDMPSGVRVFFRPNQTTGVVRPTIVKCDDTGGYEAKSFDRSRGLLPGTYGIAVHYAEVIPGTVPALERSYTVKTFDAGEVVVDPDSGGVEHNIEVPLAAR